MFKLKKTYLFFLILILIFFFFKMFIIDVKKVKGISMEKALKDGNIVVVFKVAYGIKIPFKNYYLIRWSFPKENDIIVYKKNNRFAVKRCAGISGSPIDFSFKSLYNGDTDYRMRIGARTLHLTPLQFRILAGSYESPVRKIPKNTVLALGDNFDHSYDSRDYGYVSADSIYGKVILWK